MVFKIIQHLPRKLVFKPNKLCQLFSRTQERIYSSVWSLKKPCRLHTVNLVIISIITSGFLWEKREN